MELPKMVKIRQTFPVPAVGDIEGEVARQMQKIGLPQKVAPGMKVAITAGSRGIANIALMLRTLVSELQKLGAEPRIIPAMGSHGGATAESQLEVLESLGITEAYCGAPILSSMEVGQVGETDGGLPVYADKNILESDALILMGRIKAHTDFKSSQSIESGLMKMAAIGIGKHKQALLLHSYGIHGIRDLMPEVARVNFEKLNVLCGIGIVENALEQTAVIEAMDVQEIEEREKQLLEFSKTLMPKLPVNDIDVLFVDEIGKNHSGTGMDTNIIGRLRILGEQEPAAPAIKYIIAGDLSEASHGNALGIGLADLTTRRLFNKINFQAMNENVITSSFLQRGAIPLVLDHDKAALEAALRANWGVAAAQAKVVRIASTLHLEELYVSESLLPEVERMPHVEIIGGLEPMAFDADGYFHKADGV